MSATHRVTAPWWPVAGAVSAAFAAIFLAVANAALLDSVSLPLLATGYLLGAIVTTVLASVYRALRNARLSNPRFRLQRGLDRVAGAAVGIGVLAGLANAVLLATELAKQ